MSTSLIQKALRIGLKGFDIAKLRKTAKQIHIEDQEGPFEDVLARLDTRQKLTKYIVDMVSEDLSMARDMFN